MQLSAFASAKVAFGGCEGGEGWMDGWMLAWAAKGAGPDEAMLETEIRTGTVPHLQDPP